MSELNSNSQAYQLAGADAGSPPLKDSLGSPFQAGVKQGHSCCGGCCDMRRAVIVVNIIYFCLSLLGTSTAVATRAYAIEYLQTGNQTMFEEEPELEQAFNELASAPLWSLLISSIITMLICVAGFLGAMHFNQYMVGLAFCMYSFWACWDFIHLLIYGSGSLAGILLSGFFAYPHYFFIMENRKGIMTAANYPNEKQSCCCV